MHASLKLPSLLLACLVLAVGSAQAEEPVILGEEEWKAELKLATDIQKEATNLKNRQQEPLDIFLAEDEQPAPKKIDPKVKALFIQAAQRLHALSKKTDDAKMSALCVLRAGQNYMRAEEFETATLHFDRLAIDKKVEGELRAQALYWSALSHEKMALLVDAKRLYKAITFEFPDSKWSKYARGRLADPAFQ